MSVVTRKLEDVLDAKNGAIKDLQVNTTLRSNLMRKLLRNLRYVIADKRYVIIILVRIVDKSTCFTSCIVLWIPIIYA